jgi:hypothetical protein
VQKNHKQVAARFRAPEVPVQRLLGVPLGRPNAGQQAARIIEHRLVNLFGED